jgi:hypothetical protein
VTPSRAPSNTLIASNRAQFFEAPVCFHIPYGQDKWSEIVDWCIKRGSKDSIAIDKMQLRKDHQQPYYHEYTIIFTRSGHIYRVDQRPDADAAFDTIMKEGCTAYDTIKEVNSTELREVEATSDCVVELQWRGDQTINIIIILSICFNIRNDKWAARYTLQHYNCYFVSWTIITISVRNNTALETSSNVAFAAPSIWLKWWLVEKLGSCLYD